MATSSKKKLTQNENDSLLSTLETRFADNFQRHPNINWQDVLKRLEFNPQKLWTINEMEITGGEPDVVSLNNADNDLYFVDCVAESPKGRRSICYDLEALESRKKFKPKHNAIDLAKEIGIDLLTEQEYAELQKVGPFDTKTSSWLKTPAEMRALGGALFGDFRFGRVFFYHNGAESYYAARGFRGKLVI